MLIHVCTFQDTNAGLVKQCVTSMYKKNIQRLTKVSRSGIHVSDLYECSLFIFLHLPDVQDVFFSKCVQLNIIP